jgi:multicomponent Na+:H+ antiporter subunit B
VSERGRLGLFLASAAGLGALLAWGFAGLPDFGHFDGAYGELVTRAGVAERHSTNIVTLVVFDYRGFDTVGEEFILFGAVMAVALLLREVREQDVGHAGAGWDSDAVRAYTLLLVPVTVVLGLYVVAHGHLTPGGGFQGGAVLAAALALLYLTGGYGAYRRAGPTWLADAAEGTGAGLFAAAGIAGLVTGAAYLDNVLGAGRSGKLDSGGLVPLVNLSVGLAVTAGFVLVIGEFAEELEART